MYRDIITLNQYGAMQEEVRGKVDIIDLAIIDYLYETFLFSENRINIEDKEYVLVKYLDLINEMPIIGINNKRALVNRFHKLRNLGLIETIRPKGTYMYFRFTERAKDIFGISSSQEEMDEEKDTESGTNIQQENVNQNTTQGRTENISYDALRHKGNKYMVKSKKTQKAIKIQRSIEHRIHNPMNYNSTKKHIYKYNNNKYIYNSVCGRGVEQKFTHAGISIQSYIFDYYKEWHKRFFRIPPTNEKSDRLYIKKINDYLFDLADCMGIKNNIEEIKKIWARMLDFYPTFLSKMTNKQEKTKLGQGKLWQIYQLIKNLAIKIVMENMVPTGRNREIQSFNYAY